ncbi:xanthine dehydrogenase/oxidase-like [Aricia agestis]|uniref:xanthine dehydrogenase/oxidase-like n=1 Tax=Aricia agestis TaxID=91739 RepID=UPI001C20A966|nr:xanthine dehydrogenase/oxidase-like [Aricia agestis]
MDRVTFTLNGVKHSVGNEVSSTTTLLDYIRKVAELRGTKYMCKEAGCGACIVSYSRPSDDAAFGRHIVQGVNACMVSITSCQDWEISTIEHIGNRLQGYHPLQVTLARDNGTQCGYCSPGWVMAMYSLLSTRPRTIFEIENDLSSNICRCTGYRPILDAFKKFGSDAPINSLIDIEDLKLCDKIIHKKKCPDNNKKDLNEDWYVITKEEVSSKVIHLKLHDDRIWYRVEMVNDIFNIFMEEGTDSYMLINGNTGKGVVNILEYPRLLIDISNVWELQGHYIDQNLVIGAGTTLTKVMQIFQDVSEDEYFAYLRVLSEHLELVAHIPVRNIGTVAGNLMVKHRYPEFQSDIFLLLSTVGAELTILHGPGLTEIVPMEHFLQFDMTGKVILNILFPPLNNQYKLWTHKIMPRAQNAHAYVNCGFLYKLESTTNKVLECRIAYGGLSPFFTRALLTESHIVGKSLFLNETLQEVLSVLDEELDGAVVPMPPNPSVQYRKQVALALFYKGLLALAPQNLVSPHYVTGAIKEHATRPLSSGQQEFDTDPKVYPLNKPIPKLEGIIQCAGEAKYTEDIPTLPGEVYACFVLTTVPRGRIVNIDPSRALERPGVIAFYSAKDIPGVNSFIPVVTKYRKLIRENEELLCDGDVKYFNQPLGIVVAETEILAELAATLVHVTYTDVKEPVIDIKVAKRDMSRNIFFVNIPATKVSPDIHQIISGEITIYTQYHFSMETLCCVSRPTEEGIKTYASTQWIDAVQDMTSRALKIDAGRIDVSVRRLGGAYGIKISRNTQQAVACNLVVYKLNRPCRFIQSLRTNMRAVGKRLPCSVDFEAGVNKEGVIQFINFVLYSDNGYIYNENLSDLGKDVYYNCYDQAPWNYTCFNTLTDTASNTWCRAPGTLENIISAEMVMEQIAYELGLDPLQVRLANLDRAKHNAIQEMTDTIMVKSNYKERRKHVDNFNEENRWKKRGFRFTLMKWSPYGTFYYEVNLSVFHQDGSVIISHGGVEMGQGINTKAIQICAYYFGIPVDMIQVKRNDTVTTPNGFTTAGSLTSQNIGIGVQKCCEELLRRLAPIRARLGNPTWVELIRAAFDADLSLQTHGLLNASDEENIDVYGVTLAEVEIDVLTGEHEIIRVDLIEDTGRSLNPVIDVGQVEGAFIMGLGYWTCERMVYDPQTGEVLSDHTWEYHVPQARDIPQDFRVYFRKGSFSTPRALGAKVVGEPATCMAVSVPLALREAITSARTDSGIPSTVWYEIDGPYSVENIYLNCATIKEQFKFY